MSASLLESVARDALEAEIHQAQETTGSPGPANMQVCPVWWLIPDLLQLIGERHDEPVILLRPSIRRLIRERAGIYACGAGMSEAAADELLEQQVDLLVRVLEQVRQQALDCGQWSEISPAPQMFG
jgi:hypothetical protein